MIQFNKMPLYRPKEGIIIPASGYDNKNVSFVFFPENHGFLDCFNMMGIKRQYVRRVFVPTTTTPITKLTPEYRKRLIEHKLIPIKGYFGNYTDVQGHNFYLDLSVLLNFSIRKWNITKFQTGRGLKLVNLMMNSLYGIPQTDFDRTLLYSVNLDKPIPPSLRYRKMWPIYVMLLNFTRGRVSEIPFDKFLLHIYDYTGSRFILLYDKDKPVNIARIKSILLKLKTVEDEEQEEEQNKLADEAVETSVLTKDLPEDNKEKIKHAIKTYMDSNPEMQKIDREKFDGFKDQLIQQAVSYHVVGDIDKAKAISSKLSIKPPNVRKNITKSMSDTLLTREKAKSASRDLIVKSAKPEDLVDHQIPTHILNKRKDDFSKTLKKDMVDVFKPLANRDIPLKVKDVKVKTVVTDPSELMKTVKDIYSVTLVDELSLIHI